MFTPAQWSSLKSIAFTAIGALFALAVEAAAQWVSQNQASLGFWGGVLTALLGSSLPSQINAWLKDRATPTTTTDPAAVVVLGAEESQD